MTDSTKTAILNTVAALHYAGRIHDVCTNDGLQHECVGCPFRSHYIDNPIDEEEDGIYYRGICEQNELWWGCTHWMIDMGENL